MSVHRPQPNPAQQKAIQTIQGPVMVLAGPGTGKTFTLTERIIHLLQSEIPADQILALTFTENAASEMHRRLELHLGPTARRVSIYTFHGFCQRLIQQHPELFEISPEVQVLDAVTQFEIIRSALEHHPPQFLKTERGDPFYYVREIANKISIVKREAIRSEEFLTAVEEKRMEAESFLKTTKTKTGISKAKQMISQAGKLTEFWKIHEIYNQELARRNLIDFEDMILHISNIFRNRPDFLEDLRKIYRYIHADEFQDNNSAQNEILYGLAGGVSRASAKAGEEPHLFVVGDDDQSIFRFQGACTENFMGFLQRFPQATVVTLNESHRSTASILDFTYAQISLGLGRLETQKKDLKISKQLTVPNPFPQKLHAPVRLIACATRWDETEWIANEIIRLKNDDSSLKWSDFAILFRLNREAQEIGTSLKQHEIPFCIGSFDNALTTSAVQNLISILRAIAKPEDSVALCHAMLFPPFKMMHSDIMTMNRISRSKQKPLWNILESTQTISELKKTESVAAFLEKLTAWRVLFHRQNLYPAFLELLHQSQILEFHFLSPAEGMHDQKLERVDPMALHAIRRFTHSLRDFVSIDPTATINDWLRHLDLMEIYNVPLEIQMDNLIHDERVQLLTAHKSKGLEFRIVFVTNLCATNWEQRTPRRNLIAIPPELVLRATASFENREERENEEDERRLLYVAATRARERLYFTRPTQQEDKFLDESILIAPLRESKNLQAVWEEIPALPDADFQQQIALPSHSESKSKFILERIQKFRLSPTAMYQYNLCPRQFLYAHIYLIPTKIDRHLVYGNATHEALRRFFNLQIRQRSWPPMESLIQNFIEILKGQILETANDYRELEEMGRTELSTLYAWFLKQPLPHVIATEITITEASLPSDKENISSKGITISLSGKFDRIDRSSDGSWTVVDYKTGKPRSKNDFFGKTKSSDSQYWDQFRFYKLLNQLSKGQQPIKKGRVIYIRAPEHSHEFELTEQDAAEIQIKIEKTISKIASLDFHPISETQSADACRRCAYIGLCRANL